MGIKERMSGNEAVAYAIKQVNPDVMPAFPISRNSHRSVAFLSVFSRVSVILSMISIGNLRGKNNTQIRVKTFTNSQIRAIINI